MVTDPWATEKWRAQKQALEALSELHPLDYQRLLVHENEKAGVPRHAWPNPGRTWVLAANRRLYAQRCRELRVDSNNPKQVFYVTTPALTYGVRRQPNDKLDIVQHELWTKPELGRIKHRLLELGFTMREVA